MQGKLSHPTSREVLPLPRPSTKKLFLFLLEKPVVCWSCSQNSQNRIAHPAKPAGPKLTPFRRGSRREEAIEISRNPRHPFKISFSPPFKRGKKRRGEGAPNSLSPPTWQGRECFASAASSNGSEEGPTRKKKEREWLPRGRFKESADEPSRDTEEKKKKKRRGPFDAESFFLLRSGLRFVLLFWPALLSSCCSDWESWGKCFSFFLPSTHSRLLSPP